MRTNLLSGILYVACMLCCGLGYTDEYLETFDTDPGWEGINNHSSYFKPQEIKQDFGYVPEVELAGVKGAIGGRITPDARPAYYAKTLKPLSFDTPFSASGNICMKEGGGNLLLGLFNASTLNEWRTPNTMAIRINGRGEIMHVHVEYLTSKWRAGAAIIGTYDNVADRLHAVEIPTNATYPWTMNYDPKGNDGNGEIVVTFNGLEAHCPIAPELRADGATFDHFGLLNVIKHVDGHGEVYMNELTINGEKVDLSEDPNWDGRDNRATYISTNVRPRFDFGYSSTHFAGGAAPGEFGGLFFRGDCRDAARMAACGARTEPLTLTQPLLAKGKITLRRGVTDSTTLFGFYHAEKSMEVNPEQDQGLPRQFIGFSIEGPSSEGFFAYPSYRTNTGSQYADRAQGLPRIYPDGAIHEWTLAYVPPKAGEGGSGTLCLRFDQHEATLPVLADDVAAGSFNRFGFVTPWIDGNGQVVYLDDLQYTVKQ